MISNECCCKAPGSFWMQAVAHMGTKFDLAGIGRVVLGTDAEAQHADGTARPLGLGDHQQLNSDNILTHQIKNSILHINKREAFVRRGDEGENGETSV